MKTTLIALLLLSAALCRADDAPPPVPPPAKPSVITRAYTVKEIDDLLSVVHWRVNFGSTYSTPPEKGHENESTTRWGMRSWSIGEEDKVVNEIVRTYMTAGLTADDIREQDRKDGEKYQAERAKYLAEQAAKKNGPNGPEKP